MPHFSKGFVATGSDPIVNCQAGLMTIISGKVTDDQSRPCPGATVTAAPAPPVMTNATGDYVISNAPAGSSVQVTAGGSGGSGMKTVPVTECVLNGRVTIILTGATCP